MKEGSVPIPPGALIAGSALFFIACVLVAIYMLYTPATPNQPSDSMVESSPPPPYEERVKILEELSATSQVEAQPLEERSQVLKDLSASSEASDENEISIEEKLKVLSDM